MEFRTERNSATNGQRSNKNFNKRYSLYNQLILFGQPHQGHGTLSSKADNKHSNHYKAQRVDFTLSPPETDLSLKRSFAMLDDIEQQDLFEWKSEFLSTAKIANWSEDTAATVLKSSINTNFIEGATTLSDML
ncbi:hypothetical protein DMUE_4927 [Dictyocoela muelleri]|nr:hypothetical protein DMUE_4927 [Dictyocoela muelleri]